MVPDQKCDKGIVRAHGGLLLRAEACHAADCTVGDPEAGGYGITVKGGKFLEAVAEADTVVFDKTGTLTKAKPTVKEVIPFGEEPEEECLRIAACLEEHFPHSMAKAVVDAAKKRRLAHEEMHSKVEYIVAHGISSYIDKKKVVIGSSHFVFEDEGCKVRRNTGSDLRRCRKNTPPVSCHREGADGGDLYRRSVAGRGGGHDPCAESRRNTENSHDDRGQ